MRYDGKYLQISYPNGDVPDNTGVCSDVAVRAYRTIGIDLQKDIHEDMKGSFDSYPKNWGLLQPDPNIDHRRVPNLRTLFKRKGVLLPVTRNPNDYAAGDIVTWKLPLPHIGIVINRVSTDGNRPLIVHNVGAGPVIADKLFAYKITGHYRYYGNLK